MGLAQSRRGEVLRDSDTTTGGSFILDGSFLPSFHPSRDLAQRGAPGCSGVKVCICTRFLNWLQRVCEFAAEGDAAELRGAAKCCSIVAQPVQRNRRCRASLRVRCRTSQESEPLQCDRWTHRCSSSRRASVTAICPSIPASVTSRATGPPSSRDC
eukprot:scaffold15598_cov79-Phaeocystis_antarctica.AAC.1